MMNIVINSMAILSRADSIIFVFCTNLIMKLRKRRTK